MTDVVVYTRQWCGFCTAAKSLLDKKGVQFEEIDATGNREKRQEMIQRAGGRSTFPQIFIGETHVGGCDDLFALDSTGELDRMVSA
ncbi:MAG: glutaredoxin 3 [Pseudomonadota bacterium]